MKQRLDSTLDRKTHRALPCINYVTQQTVNVLNDLSEALDVVVAKGDTQRNTEEASRSERFLRW